MVVGGAGRVLTQMPDKCSSTEPSLKAFQSESALISFPKVETFTLLIFQQFRKIKRSLEH